MDDKVFEKWYFDNWPHGETSPLHHAHKKGARAGYQAATEAAEARYKPVVEKHGRVLSDIMSFAHHDEGCHINNWGYNQIPECTCGYTDASGAALEQLEALVAIDKLLGGK